MQSAPATPSLDRIRYIQVFVLDPSSLPPVDFPRLPRIFYTPNSKKVPVYGFESKGPLGTPYPLKLLVVATHFTTRRYPVVLSNQLAFSGFDLE
jgi:hypothetical protein